MRPFSEILEMVNFVRKAAALAVAVVSAFIPFHKAVRVKIVKTGEDMV